MIGPKGDVVIRSSMNPVLLIMSMLVVVSLCTTSCHKETEEDRVRRTVTAIQKAVQEKSIRTALDQVSASYHDPRGNDRDGIKSLLAVYFFKHQRVNVYIPGIDIAIGNDRATASFQAILTGADADTGPMPEALGVYSFTVTMQKESGAWKVLSAQWERANDGPVANHQGPGQ